MKIGDKVEFDSLGLGGRVHKKRQLDVIND